ncbi:hypothetical protein [Kribbella sp. NPDC051770]|uniref:hypothetical protein n=1 Tax=Kribbella sp. NPDC051770 TaxID=3155413 RepID=UPI003413EA00
MSNKRDKGPADNPWVRKTDPDPAEGTAPEEELPPSPWSLEVPPRPSPWTEQGTPTPPANGGWGRASTDQPTKPDLPATGTPTTGSSSFGTPTAGGWGGDKAAASGATETSSAWGDKVGPPSLRRPEPVKKKPPVPPLLLPIAGGLAVVLLVAVALVVLTGGDDKAKPPTPTVTTPPASTYTPPANAIAVDHGVSIVPANGWSLLTTETQGKQLVTYAPNREPLAFLWVRQKLNVSAQTYLLGIVEGETENETTQLGAVRNLPCPKDVLVECAAISYSSTVPGKGKVQGSVEVYRRKDGVVTALDFRTSTTYAAKAESEAAPMKQSVIDSL